MSTQVLLKYILYWNFPLKLISVSSTLIFESLHIYIQCNTRWRQGRHEVGVRNKWGEGLLLHNMMETQGRQMVGKYGTMKWGWSIENMWIKWGKEKEVITPACFCTFCGFCASVLCNLYSLCGIWPFCSVDLSSFCFAFLSPLLLCTSLPLVATSEYGLWYSSSDTLPHLLLLLPTNNSDSLLISSLLLFFNIACYSTPCS